MKVGMVLPIVIFKKITIKITITSQFWSPVETNTHNLKFIAHGHGQRKDLYPKKLREPGTVNLKGQHVLEMDWEWGEIRARF